MVFRTVVKGNRIDVPAELNVPDGTEAEVELRPRKTFADLLKHVGRWVGDDSDAIIEEIYRARSSSTRTVDFDQ